MPDSFTVDPARCPLCGTVNACAMETQRQTGVPQGPCWCMTARIDEALLHGIPEKARGLACICARCATLVEG
jgi:hypothetical protein